VMHDGMQYDLIQGKGQGHEPFKVGNPAAFKSYLLRIYNGSCLVFVSRELKLAQTSVVKSRLSVLVTGLIFMCILCYSIFRFAVVSLSLLVRS